MLSVSSAAQVEYIMEIEHTARLSALRISCPKRRGAVSPGRGPEEVISGQGIGLVGSEPELLADLSLFERREPPLLNKSEDLTPIRALIV